MLIINIAMSFKAFVLKLCIGTSFYCGKYRIGPLYIAAIG